MSARGTQLLLQLQLQTQPQLNSLFIYGPSPLMAQRGWRETLLHPDRNEQKLQKVQNAQRKVCICVTSVTPSCNQLKAAHRCIKEPPDLVGCCWFISLLPSFPGISYFLPRMSCGLCGRVNYSLVFVQSTPQEVWHCCERCFSLRF